MAGNVDWLPGTRTGQLAMAKDWLVVVATNITVWKIPTTVITEMPKVIKAAENALDLSKNETTRTPVANAKCREAFDALVAYMRDMKKRYFLEPPLTASDFISLGLKPHDTIPTPSGPPTAQTTIETYLVGRHELGVKIIYVTGNPADAANKGYRIWYSVLGQNDPSPANPDDLKRSFYTKRKKDVIEFEFNDSGKTVYFAIQIENEGKKGPWGPMVQALIP